MRQSDYDLLLALVDADIQHLLSLEYSQEDYERWARRVKIWLEDNWNYNEEVYGEDYAAFGDGEGR